MSKKELAIGGLIVAAIIAVVIYKKGYDKGHENGYSKGYQYGYVQGEQQAKIRYDSQLQVVRSQYENEISELKALIDQLKDKK